jgi:hypothetical protein
MNNDFRFFVPVEVDDIEKALNQSDNDRYKNMVIKGVASTNMEDTDEEILEPSGFDITPFKKSGLINWEHLAKSGGSKYILGEPVEASIKDNQFHIKGKLWEHQQQARDLWDTLIAMKKSGSNRKLGWSIEGKAKKRDPFNKKRVLEARINHVALTFSPKNGATFADIIKGNNVPEDKELVWDETANGGQVYLLDISYDNGTRITIDKDFKIKVEKAVSTTSHAALIPESLEGNVKKQIKTIAKYKDKLDDNLMKKVSENIKKSLFKS